MYLSPDKCGSVPKSYPDPTQETIPSSVEDLDSQTVTKETRVDVDYL